MTKRRMSEKEEEEDENDDSLARFIVSIYPLTLDHTVCLFLWVVFRLLVSFVGLLSKLSMNV